MVNSSGALPPESCPWTSVPGLAVRAITSPSIGDRTKNRWVTPPEPRPRNKPARLRALGGGVRLDELAQALQLALGGGDVRLGFAKVGERRADVGRLDLHQRIAFADLLAGRRGDADDAARDWRKDVRDAQVVEGDAGGGVQRRGHLLLGDHLDPHLLRLELLPGEPHLARGGARRLAIFPPGAGDQRQQQQRPPHVRPTAASSWNTASQKSCRSLRYSARVCAQTRCASRSSRSDAAPFSYCTWTRSRVRRARSRRRARIRSTSRRLASTAARASWTSNSACARSFSRATLWERTSACARAISPCCR